MSVLIVTGSGGLIGSEAASYFAKQGLDIVGIDNNMRTYFFGADGSVSWNIKKLQDSLKLYTHEDLDIRNETAINALFKRYGRAIKGVIHCAAQPSHDWAAREPLTDFSVNANGTLVLLEATRQFCPEASFIFTSTNKVYGDRPNSLPLVEQEKRWEIQTDHPYFEMGIDEEMSLDATKHSLFGASKVAADVLVQEYGRYFGMNTVSFRGGCLTGPAHSGAELHGFLAYLVKCAITARPYTIFGYKGKQVRDNIHSYDLVQCFSEYLAAPRSGAVYNIGGSRHSHCSVLEAIDMIEHLSGKRVQFTLSPEARSGDHIWWVSDVSKFKNDYPAWQYRYGLRDIIGEIIEACQDRLE